MKESANPFLRDSRRKRPRMNGLAGSLPFIRSNLCTRHILNKITPRGHEDWPDKRRSVYESKLKGITLVDTGRKRARGTLLFTLVEPVDLKFEPRLELKLALMGDLPHFVRGVTEVTA